MKKIFIISLLSLLAASCSDYLDVSESMYQSTEYQFATFENTKKVCTDVYGRLVSYLSDTENTMRDVATDDAVYAWETSYIKTYWDGSWSAGRAVDDKWSYYYGAIAAANYFLEHCPDDFPASQYMETYKERIQQLRVYPLEVTVLRAFFHFELLKRYGSIKAIRQADLGDLGSVLPKSTAKAVYEYFRNENTHSGEKNQKV